jgi:catechol 2,3-dioxygenase-like lactoylglutathione lyase family enzyme
MIMDLGLTHVAFAVPDLQSSIHFYEHYASMSVIHRRSDINLPSKVAWLTDFTRPFIIVLVQAPSLGDTPLGPFGHLGIGCSSRETVDRLAADAAHEDRLLQAPTDSGPPVGYWALISDPDGNTLEVAHGQQVAFTVEQAKQLK